MATNLVYVLKKIKKLILYLSKCIN